MLIREKALMVPDAVIGSHLAVPFWKVTCRERSLYVRLSCVVPAGTVGGSVSITTKGYAWVVTGVGKSVGLANITAAIMAIDTSTAAPPYLKVCLFCICLSSKRTKTRSLDYATLLKDSQMIGMAVSDLFLSYGMEDYPTQAILVNRT